MQSSKQGPSLLCLYMGSMPQLVVIFPHPGELQHVKARQAIVQPDGQLAILRFTSASCSVSLSCFYLNRCHVLQLAFLRVHCWHVDQ
jgi:hypothetical protein